MRHLFALLALLSIMVFAAHPALCGEALPDAGKLSTLAGEQLHYDITWSGVPAGTAKMSVTDKKNGEYTFFMSARTNGSVSFLYPLKVKYISTVGADDFRPLLYVREGREGWGDKVKRHVVYDHEEGVSRYTKNGTLKRTLEITPDVIDPISILYAIRTMELPGPGGSLAIKVCDGKKVVTGSVNVIRKETVKTPLGTFEAIKVQPVMKGVKGVFGGENSSMSIWLSDDETRRIVKIESDVAVGTFIALLGEATYPPAPSSQPPQDRQ